MVAPRVAVVGAGAWGTTLARLVARVEPVTLLCHSPETAARIATTGRNEPRLPGVDLPPTIVATADPATLRDATDLVIFATPSAHLRTTVATAAPHLAPSADLLSVVKGLERDTLQRMSQVIAEAAGARIERVAALSGPNLAAEIARNLPASAVVAAGDLELAERIVARIARRRFRLYVNEDILGVELCGALKNVIAIAAGILDGLGLGHNTLAALITRGLAEIARLSVACGARADTLSGLAGLGDLVLTCTGALSRNRHVGQALGRGLTLEQALAETGMVAEGVRTTPAACALAARQGVEMPIAAQMKAVLQEGKPPREALEELMLRSLKRE